MTKLFGKMFFGVTVFAIIACISLVKPVYATTTNVTQENPLLKEMTDDVMDIYDGLFKIVFGDDYDISKVTYDYISGSWIYENEKVTEEQLSWLIYYLVYMN